jgi:lambda family phage portal protein
MKLIPGKAREEKVLGNIIDRAINYLSPRIGSERMQERMRQELASSYWSSGAGGYDAGSHTRRETSTWNPFPSDADSATAYNLSDLRARSRDAVRNQPIATGIVGTCCTNVVGRGLTLQPIIDRDLLGLDEAQAEEWQRHTRRRWNLWANSQDCDLARTANFNALCNLALRQRLENGEAFALLPVKPVPGGSNPLRVQMVEADRVCNKGNVLNSTRQVEGVLKDEDGAPVAYQILRGHPGNVLYSDKSRWEWDDYAAFNSETGIRNVIHFFRQLRPGQSRGVPELAPVIEPLRTLSRLTRAELAASVVSAMFTVFVKSENGQSLNSMSPLAGPKVSAGPGDLNSKPQPADLKLGEGAVVDLASGESIEIADPKRPNAAFDPFWLAIVRQIGIAIGIPYEVLIKHYTASYSAARAAIEDAWQYFLTMRADLIDNFVSIIYAAWMVQEVAQGTIYAPGFFTDPGLRAAWLGANWKGPAKRQIDPVKEINAAEKRVEMEITTLDQETAEMTGGDWSANHKERTRENRQRREDGTDGPLVAAAPAPAPPAAEPNPDLPEAS